MKQQNIKLLIAFLMSMLGVNVSAHHIEVANTDGIIIYYRYINNNTELEVSYRGSSYDSYSNEYSGNVVIPESVTYNGNTYSVTRIGDLAFVYCRGLTSVTIPNSVTSIGGSAFCGCSGLTNVTIPNSVTSIGRSAFLSCSGLTSITIPNSVTSIGSSAFEYCSGLTSVKVPATDFSKFCRVINLVHSEIGNPRITMIDFDGNEITEYSVPEGVTSIGDRAFDYCSGLTSITIPNSVTSIGDYAFENCSGLTSITIGNSVTSIGGWAFSGCSGLKSVYISDLAAWCNISFSDNPLYYAHHLFLNGEEIKDLVIPNSVTSIGGSAFSGCYGLTSITIPNSVTSIGREAFYGCSGLTSITIPNSVTSIGEGAFYECSGLTSITIPNSVTSIGGGAFNGCSGLTSVTIPNSVTSIGGSAFYNCSGLTSVSIPNSVTSIGSYAFYNCSGLTSVSIPNSVTSIGSYAFEYCSGLTSIKISATDFSEFCRVKNLVLPYIGKTLITMIDVDGNEITEYSVPEGVTSIEDNAFYGWSGLTSITIPNSVTSIGSYAFSGCSGLTSITIPNSVTSIGSYAFSGCSGLTSITIPNSVTSIGWGAFSGCSGLTSITIPNSVTSIENYAFEDCSGLTSVTIGNSVTSIGERTFYNCSSLTSVTIPNSVTSIGNYAFEDCSGLTSVTIGNSVTSIGERTFYNCSSLTSLTLGSGVQSLDKSAFSGCDNLTSIDFHCRTIESWFNNRSSLKSIIIGDEVETVGNNAFSGCSGLTSVTIGNSVTSIGNYAFSGCSGLTSVTIPNSVTSIGRSAFYNCSGLTSVTIPNSVTSIDSYAFCYCSDLTSITIPNSVTSIGYSAFYGCSGLTSVTIGNSVTSIGSDAFSGCSLTSIKVYATDFTKFCRIINLVHSYIGKPLITMIDFDGNEITEYSIPEGVTSIESSAFYGCSGLTNVTIPNSVTSIGSQAFSGCSGLTNVNISDLAAWCNISFSDFSANPLYYGNHLFLNGEEIIDLVIPNSVTSIGRYAFEGCSGLTSITIPNSVTSIGGGAFSGCSALTSVISEIIEPFNCGTDAFPENACRNGTLYVPAGTKDLYIRFDGWRNFLHIEEGGEAAKYKLSFVVNNKELSTKNVELGATIAPPTTDGEGNTITWYTYPATMPAHDLVVYGMVVKPEPAPAPAKYTLTYMLDGQQYKQVTIEAGAAVAKETAPSKEGYTFSGWQNEPATMPAQNTTVTGRFTINSYRLSFIAENRELSSKNVTYGSQITAPSTDGEGNTITWYTYPTTMPAHDLVVYGMVVKQPEPEVLVWLTVKDGQGTTRMKVRQGTEQVLTITPEEGWKVVSVTWNGTDVTAQTKDGGSYTTPAITGDATLAVVYEQDAPSEVASARAGQATVTVVDDGVVIAHAEPQSRCVVYTSNGQPVVSTVIEGDNQKIRLQKGQVYILTINGRTLKFAL